MVIFTSIAATMATRINCYVITSYGQYNKEILEYRCKHVTHFTEVLTINFVKMIYKMYQNVRIVLPYQPS